MRHGASWGWSEPAVRAFLAIELSHEVRRALDALSARLRQSRVKATWVRAENLHLSLRFLGDVDAPVLEHLGGFLAREYATLEPFRLHVAGVGCFPNRRRARVIWAGVQGAPVLLEAAHRLAESGARQAGLKAGEKAFAAHVTLARIRKPGPSEALAESLDAESEFDGGEFSVGGVSLFSSTLSPGGAIYRKEREFPFRWTQPSTTS